MTSVVRRALLVAIAAGVGWYGGHPAVASPVCAEHLLVGRLCVQPDPDEPVTCEQTGALATCDLLGDPCGHLSICRVCPTGDPCDPPPNEW